MPDMLQQLREDRALRNAARALIDADVEILKGDVNPKPKAQSLLDKTRDGVNANKSTIGGVLVLLVAGALLYVFRDSLKELVAQLLDQSEDEEQDEADNDATPETKSPAERSDNEPEIDPQNAPEAPQ